MTSSRKILIGLAAGVVPGELVAHLRILEPEALAAIGQTSRRVGTPPR